MAYLSPRLPMVNMDAAVQRGRLPAPPRRGSPRLPSAPQLGQGQALDGEPSGSSWGRGRATTAVRLPLGSQLLPLGSQLLPVEGALGSPAPPAGAGAGPRRPSGSPSAPQLLQLGQGQALDGRPAPPRLPSA